MPKEITAILVETGDDTAPINLTDNEHRHLIKGFTAALFYPDGQPRYDVLPPMEMFEELQEMAKRVVETEAPLTLNESSMDNFTACLALIEGKDVLSPVQRRLFKRLLKQLGHGGDEDEVVDLNLEQSFDPTKLD